MNRILLCFIACVLPVSAQSVVSLAPSLSETVCYLGACDRLVGVTDYCLYPKELESKTRVGGYMNPSLEKIVSLEPGLVLALPEHRDLTEKLTSLGLKVATVRNYYLDDIPAAMRQIGSLLNLSEKAETLASAWEARRDALSASLTKAPSCMLVLGHDGSPRQLRDIYLVGNKGFLNDMLRLAGGRNAWQRDKPFFPKLDQEGLLSLDPDIIIELVPVSEMTKEGVAERKRIWQEVPYLRAVEDDRYYVVFGDHVLQAGPRSLDTLEQLRQVIGPK